LRVLIIDQDRVGLDFALRCAAAGHDVRWFLYAKKPSRDGEGFKRIQMVDDWRPHMKWAKDGLIICTHNGKYIREIDRYREFGYKIFGPTPRSAELEIKRSVGMEAMQAVGIDVPPYHTFASLEEALKFAWKAQDPFVFKTMGDEEDKSLSFVPHDPGELAGWIQSKINAGMKLKGPCMLQEKIEMLAEVGVSGWFGPDGFLPEKWQICFEHKKLMDYEVGPNTGEMGSVTQYCKTDKLAAETLLPMEPILRVLGHRGDFAIGAGVDTKGRIWPFEFTARLGYPAFYIQTASHKGDPAQWMRDLLDGEDTLKVSRDAAIGVLMAQPPFPYDQDVRVNPIGGLDDVSEDDIHLVSALMERGPVWEVGKIVEKPIVKTANDYVLVATSLGKTVEQAREKVYGVIDQIKFPDAIYRHDIGLKVQKVLPDLHDFGFALDLEA